MTYFTCRASAITPAAMGADALVPVKESVHLLLVSIVAYYKGIKQATSFAVIIMIGAL